MVAAQDPHEVSQSPGGSAGRHKALAGGCRTSLAGGCRTSEAGLAQRVRRLRMSPGAAAEPAAAAAAQCRLRPRRRRGGPAVAAPRSACRRRRHRRRCRAPRLNRPCRGRFATEPGSQNAVGRCACHSRVCGCCTQDCSQRRARWKLRRGCCRRRRRRWQCRARWRWAAAATGGADPSCCRGIGARGGPGPLPEAGATAAATPGAAVGRPLRG
mmetsp:Transcript_60265/g.197049  ORF Transcript_60265/g.197049 Transcript_60265/m.197049 type:complete len:213 (-) Transcript_60265:850-1488(-)